MTMKEAFLFFFEMVMSYEQAKRGGRWVWFAAACADTTTFFANVLLALKSDPQ
jgi:hypothetical protein